MKPYRYKVGSVVEEDGRYTCASCGCKKIPKKRYPLPKLPELFGQTKTSVSKSITLLGKK